MASTAAGRKRILVADDVPENIDLITRYLGREGYDVVAAVDGEEALALARQLRPDLIILDIMMPKIHGMDVLKQLKADPETRPIGVMMCSAKGFKPDIDAALELGAVAFMDKPVDWKKLALTVREFFQGTAPKPANTEAPPATPPPVSPKAPAAAPAATPPPPVAPASSWPLTGRVDTSRGYCKFWGTRGSIPISGPRFARHGGNTSCLEITCGDDTVIIDAGSGIRDLGMDLLARKRHRMHLFVGHTHWDHIQGFPFFTPAYIPGFDIQVYGAKGFGKNLEQVFRGQLDRDYFPVELNDMAAKLTFNTLTENPMVIGGIKIFWEFMVHPGATVGFRIEAAGRRIGYITDNEFLKGYQGPPEDVAADNPLIVPSLKILELVAGVDLLVCESQYFNDEYTKKIGWGHTSLSNGALFVKHANVKRWVVTHHDPMHDDEKLQEKLMLTRQLLDRIGHHAEVSHAFDGMIEPL